MKEPLEDLVRRVDEDRWLASRFAPPETRKRLIALYAFNYEVAHVGESATDANLGLMRLQFWADAIEAIYAGKDALAQPALVGLSEAIKDANLPRVPFDALIEARKRDLEPAPFDTWAELEAYLDATAGGLFDLAIRVCTPEQAADAGRENLARACGRAWGYVGLARALAHWTAKKRTFFPRRVREHVGLTDEKLFHSATPDHATVAAQREVLDRATIAQREVRRYSPSANKEMFPAIGYVTLVRPYVRGAYGVPGGIRDLLQTSLMARQFRMVGAAASGSI